MTIRTQTKGAKLRESGITLAYLAKVAGRSAAYVRQWSRGKDTSAYLDRIAAELVAKHAAVVVEGGEAK